MQLIEIIKGQNQIAQPIARSPITENMHTLPGYIDFGKMNAGDKQPSYPVPVFGAKKEEDGPPEISKSNYFSF